MGSGATVRVRSASAWGSGGLPTTCMVAACGRWRWPRDEGLLGIRRVLRFIFHETVEQIMLQCLEAVDRHLQCRDEQLQPFDVADAGRRDREVCSWRPAIVGM